eukprot:Phypoly_transcript_08769.p1 GENE.Phypoly_transcript_08769~~Phypoly_transcript_08769.p1  ORF type:complete len:427 (+),score=60.23 Phypoly_transcript_08769:153-1283(+)
MDSHLASLRPYPPSFPSPSASGLVSPSSRSRSHAFDQGPLPLSPNTDDNSRKRRSLQETTWAAPTASQSSRIPASPLSSPSPASHLPVSPSGRSWNEAKRRKLAQEYKQVSSSHSLSDTIASSALTSLSLSIYAKFTPTNLESPSLHSFPPEKVSPSSLGTSPLASPTYSPLSSSSRSSETLLSSSCEVGSSAPQSPSSTPPSSPHPQMKLEIRHKGKQLKSRCTCCHVCRTSLKNYPRPHLDCTACNAVVCQPCIEFRLAGPSWEEASKEPNWLCPSCLNTCVCQRCTSRPLEIVSQSEFTSKKKFDDNKNKKRTNSDSEARQKRLEELLEYHRERDKFIHEIQNVLCIVKRDQREIECQIAALQYPREEDYERS